MNFSFKGHFSNSSAGFSTHAKKTISLIAVVLAVVLMPACSKKEPLEPAAEETIYGAWHFDVRILSSYMDPSIPVTDETYSHSGTIEKGVQSNEILIQYLPDYQAILQIDSANTLSGFPTHYSHGEFTGTNRLDLLLRWGGLGGGTSHVITGTKK